MRSFWAFAVLLAAQGLVGSAGAAGGGSVSFAEPSDWTVKNHERNLTIAFGRDADGVDTLCISGATRQCDTAWSACSRKFPLTKGARGFRLSFGGYVDRDVMGTRPSHGFCNAVFWYDASGKEIGMGVLAFAIAKKLKQSVYATWPIPADARFAAVQFGFDSPNLGPGQNLVYSGFTFETLDWPLKSAGTELQGQDRRPPRVFVASASPTTDRNVVLRLGVEDDSGVKWESAFIEIDGRDVSSSFVREGGELVQKRRAAPWTEGLHRIRYAVADTKGNVETNRLAFLIGECPRTPKVTLRDDGVTLIDGKPFFPIGICGVSKREFNGMSYDKAFQDLRDAGFNLAHTYRNAYDPEYLAAAEKYGIRLFVQADGATTNMVDIGRHRPCVLAWYLGDDTSMTQTPAQLRSRRDSVTAVDPTRITCQADVTGQKGTLNVPYCSYVDGTDVIMPEIYPVSGVAGDSSDRTCVARTIGSMQAFLSAAAKAKDGTKACWPILQYFQGWSSWLHFPTREQLFATTFAAIIHGAQGVTWYTYGGFYNKRRDYHDEGITSRPERFRNMADLCTWLRELTPALVARKGVQPTVGVTGDVRTDSDGRPAVSALLKCAGGEAFLLTVNAAPEKTRARFALKGLTGRIEVMRENRMLQGQDGFEDDFGPFAVHVYRWELGGTK